MDQPFIGDVRPWPHPVPPAGWLACDGSVLPIAQYEVLFSVIGTTYGGDGEETFRVPDLRGRLPAGAGTGPGLTPRSQGSIFGTEQETISIDQLPTHSHPVRAQSGPATTASPLNAYFAHAPDGAYASSGGSGVHVPLDSDSLKATGGSRPHTNMPPYLVMNFIIAVYGIYPPAP